MTIKWFLAFTFGMGWEIQHLDIDSAYLNGKLDQQKFIRIPQGFEGDNKTHIGQLNKSLYGLAIAPMCWFKTFTTLLKNNDFRYSPREPCLFVKNVNKNKILILIYVDDIYSYQVILPN